MRVIFAILLVFGVAGFATAQNGPLRLEITDGVIEPLTFAVPQFQAETPDAAQAAQILSRVVAADLVGSGLFREISANSFVAQRKTFNEPVRYPDWRAINAQGLITGAVSMQGGQMVVKFRVYDIFAGSELGTGLQLIGSRDAVRRMAHKVADQVYTRITGETPYFDSRVVYVSETGPKDNRQKRLAIMDYDGANVQYLTGSDDIVLAPRFSKDGRRVLYTSYETGQPQIYVIDVGSVRRRLLPTPQGGFAFSPRFSPNGQRVVYSYSQGGNTDIFLMDIDLPGMDGIDGIGAIKERLPEAIVLILTVFEDDEKIFRALKAGASG
ncbi:MAG: response regulator, partial [Pseudomonadota bacterium]